MSISMLDLCMVVCGQEWGGEGLAEAGGAGSAVLEGVALQPMALHFGSAALAAPHVRSVTLTNTGNATLHLASVAGTTPDFHASFFESKCEQSSYSRTRKKIREERLGLAGRGESSHFDVERRESSSNFSCVALACARHRRPPSYHFIEYNE
ncbi:hypothetical protein RR48_06866 [Papilio machaon]|uniref:Transmembrane protein 131-like N-terminal domain-containing protein n=1 Tax=Papilio machaon TaxID=76193 RepID=A0A194RAQ7_PAPMA|nr:hypothetical protein RR48_06866 [Papilio machaon]